MTLFRRCFLIFLLIVSTPAMAAGDADWLYRGSDIPRDSAWTFGTLPNGLRYAVRQNKLPAGQVSIRVRIDAGSLHEEDNERGWAHLVEHMAFRGSKSFGDREARYIWQTLGASFGSDTNASTSPTQTVYQLDLPKNDRANLDQSLHVLSRWSTPPCSMPPRSKPRNGSCSRKRAGCPNSRARCRRRAGRFSMPASRSRTA
jgi:zinc protease